MHLATWVHLITDINAVFNIIFGAVVIYLGYLVIRVAQNVKPVVSLGHGAVFVGSLWIATYVIYFLVHFGLIDYDAELLMSILARPAVTCTLGTMAVLMWMLLKCLKIR